MNYYIIIGIIGIISGILCAQADVPLAWSGKKEDAVDAKTVGHFSPWWTTVNERHFDLSFWLSCIGQPGTYLTTWFLAELISESCVTLGTILKSVPLLAHTPVFCSMQPPALLYHQINT